MFRFFILLSFSLFFGVGSQAQTVNLNRNWQFSKLNSDKWYKATVPGTVHTDLLKNRLISDPYYRDNEKGLQWIGETNWVYKTTFNADQSMLRKKNIKLVFDGLDTYADVFLNGKKIIGADNMFRQWKADIKPLIRQKNELQIIFYSAKLRTDSLAKANLPLVVPCENPRLYARKAQYHFGWDWGPRFVTAGIWKNVYVEAFDIPTSKQEFIPTRNVELVQEADSAGRSFYFKIDRKPVYMKGANYIPSDMFVTRLTKDDYRKVLMTAKNANMNMLRIWGGGIYEHEDFYDLCDSLGIYIWQDFMFAGQMVPTDEKFFDNVREEVKYQIQRLRKHPSIVLWCGNNEVDEAWHNWGWQKQFNVHGEDSAKLWHAYTRLFRDSIAAWVKKYDHRPYISTSPELGWGREKSITQGDSHYWGFWWGLQDVEIFETKTGRFASEWGMIGMPNYSSVLKFTTGNDRFLFSDVLKSHVKAGDGYSKVLSYVQRYFMDSVKAKALSVEDFNYLSQTLQYYLLKNAIAIQRSKYPVNMGTLLWQLNDCWPVASWSITDYYNRTPKAAWYAVREAFREDIKVERDDVRPINLKLKKPTIVVKPSAKNAVTVSSDVDARYVYIYAPGVDYKLSDNYFNLKPGETKKIIFKEPASAAAMRALKVKTLYDVLK